MTAEEVDQFERDNSAPMTVCEKIGAAFILAAPLLAAAAVAVLCCAGCATKTSAIDGTGIQANQYSGLTVFSGSLLSIAQGMEFCETYEDVSTSWWNFGRYNYKRRTTWASSSTNEPPSKIAEVFAPNVDTLTLYKTSSETNSGSVISALALDSKPTEK